MQGFIDNLAVIIPLIGATIGLLSTTITFLLKFIKNAKARAIAENILKISNSVVPYITEAEKFLNYTGAEKKEYVMTKASQYAIERGMYFDSFALSKKIDELVKLTKEVNSNQNNNLKQGEL